MAALDRLVRATADTAFVGLGAWPVEQNSNAAVAGPRSRGYTIWMISADVEAGFHAIPRWEIPETYSGLSPELQVGEGNGFFEVEVESWKVVFERIESDEGRP